MSSADRRSGAFCAGAENAPLQVADSANARQREKNGAFSRGTAKNAGHLRGKDNMSWEEEEARS